MLRLTPRRKRVPNVLAAFGAFLLVTSALGGAGQALRDARQQGIAQHDVAATAQDAGNTGDFESADAIHEPAVTKTRKFRVNLFLFRH